MKGKLDPEIAHIANRDRRMIVAIDNDFASSGEFVGDLPGLAGRLTEESEKLTAGGIKGSLLLL